MKDEKKHGGTFIHEGKGGHPLMPHPEGEEPEVPVDGPGARTVASKDDSGDAMYKYDKEGVPVSRDPYEDAKPRHEEKAPKKGQGTEDAQKRSDTGTGL